MPGLYLQGVRLDEGGFERQEILGGDGLQRRARDRAHNLGLDPFESLDGFVLKIERAKRLWRPAKRSPLDPARSSLALPAHAARKSLLMMSRSS